MIITAQRARVAPPRPRLVELDSLPATFSASGVRGDRDHARIAPRVVPDQREEHLTPLPVSALPEQQASQPLVRYVRKAAAAAMEVETKPVAARRRAAAPRRSTPRRRVEAAADVMEELLAVVGECLGLGVGAIARAIYGKETASGRARVAALLDGLGSRGREMALRLARLMLDRPAGALVRRP